MSEHFRSLFDSEASPDEACKPAREGLPSGSVLTDMISDLLCKQWLNEDPSELCFDRDSARMELLLSFVEGNRPHSELDEVREHILACPRCRLIFARVREACRAAPEPPPELLNNNLRTGGPVVFPGGEVADQAWEFGMLNELSVETAESWQLVRLLRRSSLFLPATNRVQGWRPWQGPH